MSLDLDGARPDLELREVSVTFGGLKAVDGVSLRAPAGQVTGLIGPNGAGKSTTFNACTGVVPVTAGSVQLGDHTLDRMATSQRAQVGLGRTFQRIELVDSMTVLENVQMGRESLLAGSRPWSYFVAPRAQATAVADAAWAAIERCGLQDLAHRPASELSTGQGRLAELARALTAGFSFLLLDEPSSGLDVEETRRFGEVLESWIAETGVGILLVEHDMSLVRQLCSYLYVLEFGRLLTQGTAAEVLASDLLRSAYLGTEAAD